MYSMTAHFGKRRLPPHLMLFSSPAFAKTVLTLHRRTLATSFEIMRLGNSATRATTCSYGLGIIIEAYVYLLVHAE